MLCQACENAPGQPAAIGPDLWSSLCPDCTTALQKIEDDSWGGKERELRRDVVRLAHSIHPTIGAQARRNLYRHT